MHHSWFPCQSASVGSMVGLSYFLFICGSLLVPSTTAGPCNFQGPIPHHPCHLHVPGKWGLCGTSWPRRYNLRYRRYCRRYRSSGTCWYCQIWAHCVGGDVERHHPRALTPTGGRKVTLSVCTMCDLQPACLICSSEMQGHAGLRTCGFTRKGHPWHLILVNPVHWVL
jgi:hypothetical protein